jgi:RNA polymerase sigma-70 factor (ECF subfamily)
MVPTLSDAELAERIGRGECAAEAEAELARRMGPRVRQYGLRHLRDAHAADDLAQHVLMTTLSALREGRVREPAKLASFVLGTCRMAAMDLRRGQRRRESLAEQYGSHRAASLASEAGLEIDRERLERCLQALAERERTVVVLTFYDEHTRTNLPDSLGVTEANLRVIRHRAIRRLRHCMGTGETGGVA